MKTLFPGGFLCKESIVRIPEAWNIFLIQSTRLHIEAKIDFSKFLDTKIWLLGVILFEESIAHDFEHPNLSSTLKDGKIHLSYFQCTVAHPESGSGKGFDGSKPCAIDSFLARQKLWQVKNEHAGKTGLNNCNLVYVNGITSRLGAYAGYFQFEIIIFIYTHTFFNLASCLMYRVTQALPPTDGYFFAEKRNSLIFMAIIYVTLVIPPCVLIPMSRINLEIVQEKLRKEVSILSVEHKYN
jgi:hypothetical protein